MNDTQAAIRERKIGAPTQSTFATQDEEESTNLEVLHPLEEVTLSLHGNRQFPPSTKMLNVISFVVLLLCTYTLIPSHMAFLLNPKEESIQNKNQASSVKDYRAFNDNIGDTNGTMNPKTDTREAGTRSTTFSPDGTELPLKPPFYLVQLGQPRSGSTFQVTLLDTIATLKTQQWKNRTSKIELATRIPERKLETGFVAKLHHQKHFEKKMNKTAMPFHLFTSAQRENFFNFSFMLYNQTLPKLNNCSLCEIENYIPIFGLTPDDVQFLKSFMGRYEIIRQCCGFQQSKYNMFRLHGCNVTRLLLDHPGIPYPYCERYNLTRVELEFANMPISYRTRSPKKNWRKPGDCARSNEMVAEGAGFNNQIKNYFKTCDDFEAKYFAH